MVVLSSVFGVLFELGRVEVDHSIMTRCGWGTVSSLHFYSRP